MLPPFLPPVRRPEVVQPFRAVSLPGGSGDQIISMIYDLLHGANYNCPQRFVSRQYERVKSSASDCTSCRCRTAL